MLRLSTLGIPTGLGRSRFEDLLIQLFCLSLLLIPVGFLTIKSWVTTLSLVAFLLAITLLVMNDNRIKLTKFDALVCFTFASLFLADLGAQLLRNEWLLTELDASSRLIIFIPIYLTLKGLCLRLEKIFGLSISMGLIFSAGHIYAQPDYYWGDRWASQPSDPNTLGLFTATMLGYLFFSLNGGSKSITQRAVTVIAIFSGTLILIGSQSRGAWLAAAVLLFIAVWLKRETIKDFAVMVLFPLLLTTITLTFLNPNLVDRAVSIPDEIVGWIERRDVVNSGSTRLDMIKLSRSLAANVPALVHGYGDGGYKESALAIAKTQVELAAADTLRVTPHNEVIGKLLKSGVMGALAALSVLLVPVIAALLMTKGAGGIHLPWLGLALGTCLASLTMGVLGLSYTASFHAVTSAILLNLVQSPRSTSSP